MPQEHRLIPALDVQTLDEAKRFCELFLPHVSCVKIGLGLYIPYGYAAVTEIQQLGADVFLDLKFGEKPSSVETAAAFVASLGVTYFTVYASGGVAMMRKAANVKSRSIPIAVTVPTWLTLEEIQRYYGQSDRERICQSSSQRFLSRVSQKVITMAEDAVLAGIDTIVCSPRELEDLNSHPSLRSLKKIIPGVRSLWYTSESDEQKRIYTPRKAIEFGAAAVVIGQPILNPPLHIGTPVDALKRVIEEIQNAAIL